MKKNDFKLFGFGELQKHSNPTIDPEESERYYVPLLKRLAN
uniref:Uncharacterized protein n=1 Tax=Bartonella ancashensis TaxID=1318743 RepID=A0A1V0PND6_9HYPH|nr:hypothetical protein [Bartonella ancashensis]